MAHKTQNKRNKLCHFTVILPIQSQGGGIAYCKSVIFLFVLFLISYIKDILSVKDICQRYVVVLYQRILEFGRQSDVKNDVKMSIFYIKPGKIKQCTPGFLSE